MKALVTGHLGFIGRYVTARLAADGYEITGVDVAGNPPLDARDYFRHNGEEFALVVHCAAVVGGRRVIDWTPIQHAQNLEIDAALFQWAERVRPGRVVYFSSSCAYPAVLGQPGQRSHRREDDITWPPGPACWPDGLYGWAKLTGELLARTAQAAGVPVTIVRPFSVYGPGVKDGFAVHGFLEQVKRRADPLVIWGDEAQVRDYIHVADVAAAVAALIAEGVDGPVNLGTGRGTPLWRLATMMAGVAGYQPQIKTDTSMPAGIPSLVADPTRLHEFYKPQVALKDWITEAAG